MTYLSIADSIETTKFSFDRKQKNYIWLRKLFNHVKKFDSTKFRCSCCWITGAKAYSVKSHSHSLQSENDTKNIFIAICYKCLLVNDSEHVRLLKLFVKKLLSFSVFHFLIFQVYWVRILFGGDSFRVWWSLITVFCRLLISWSGDAVWRKLAIWRIDMKKLNFFCVQCHCLLENKSFCSIHPITLNLFPLTFREENYQLEQILSWITLNDLNLLLNSLLQLRGNILKDFWKLATSSWQNFYIRLWIATYTSVLFANI